MRKNNKIELFIYRYEATYYEEYEGTLTDTGFACGTSMGDAVDRINALFTIPSTGVSQIISLKIWEVDDNNGILNDVTIKEELA